MNIGKFSKRIPMDSSGRSGSGRRNWRRTRKVVTVIAIVDVGKGKEIGVGIGVEG